MPDAVALDARRKGRVFFEDASVGKSKIKARRDRKLAAERQVNSAIERVYKKRQTLAQLSALSRSGGSGPTRQSIGLRMGSGYDRIEDRRPPKFKKAAEERRRQSSPPAKARRPPKPPARARSY